MTTARELTDRLLDLLRREQGAMADFLVALADFDRRRLWMELGFPSLFHFLHRRLGLSAGAAHYRKTAAELIQRFPQVVGPLRDGRLCFTSICELARVISEENRAEVLPRFFHASKQEAKAIAAEIAPREAAPHRAVVTALALPAGCAAPAIALGQDAIHPDETAATQANVPAPAMAPSLSHRTTTEPLTADLRRLHVTVSKRFLAKLDASRAALSHSHPGADAEAILEAGLDLLLDRAARRKGIVAKPRGSKAPSPSLHAVAGESRKPVDVKGPDSRHIPAAVKREVWIRDGGRCQWPVDGGGVCGSTHQVEFDHVFPRARGGDSTVANLRLCCRVHNQHSARLVFGEAWMGQFRREASP